MNTQIYLQPDEEILQIFKDLEEKALQVNPALLSEINSFNENHVAIESYQSFINTINQSPLLTASNHVSQ